MTTDYIGAIAGAVLTVLTLSYILGDNPLYRLALHILVGASVGYAVAMAANAVLDQAVVPALQGGTAEQYSLLLPVLLGILLLFKAVPRWAPWGNVSMAFLMGVGAAVAISGALLGTILPQATATGSMQDWLQSGMSGLVINALVAAGTICALLAFTFTTSQRRGLAGLWASAVRLAGGVGRFFLVVAFGTVFAGALTASLSVLIGRIYAILGTVDWEQLLRLIGG